MYYICTQYGTSIKRSLKDYNTKRENSSVGRARPCQGRGRGFEPRFRSKLPKKYLLEWWNW